MKKAKEDLLVTPPEGPPNEYYWPESKKESSWYKRPRGEDVNEEETGPVVFPEEDNRCKQPQHQWHTLLPSLCAQQITTFKTQSI
jgi:hypothetical protein